MRKIFTVFIVFLLLSVQAAWAQSTTQPKYLQNIVVFKLKPQQQAAKMANRGSRTLSFKGTGPAETASAMAKKLGARKAFPAVAFQEAAKTSPMARGSQKNENPFGDIYKLELQPGQDVQAVIAQLLSSKEVEYAEPYYLPELLHLPDDEFIPQQTYLNVIKAFDAWDISQGNRDVVIGILDTGVDFDHPDLKENLYLNAADTLDGIDNDGDGFIDNYKGWDFANHDNDPTDNDSGHGTLVSGFSSASTNNDIGVAGTGYKCRYMPIKVFRSENGIFSNGYEAMVYAANMGCKVINLSWGAAGFRSQYVQDIINYVVLEKDVVIVAAAGNKNEELNFYPASYDNVLSVSSSDVKDRKDEKSAYATWSRYVDILAPGNETYNTSKGGSYRTGTGTSFASPIVAGAAALLRSYFPELSAQQVMERLRVSADDVSQLGSNVNFVEKIGKGRLNMRRALDKSVSPAVRMQQFEIFNGSGPFAFYNDTVEIRMDFKNFLSVTTKLQVEISTSSPYVTILDKEVQLGAINTLETARNTHQPFRIYLHPDLPNNETITFRLGYSDINYNDYQHFEFRASGDYLDYKSDELTLTISSNGNLGYDYDFNLNGSGFRYQNTPIAHNLGLVLAQSQNAVANNIVKHVNPAIRDQDFKTLSRLKLFNNSTAYRDARSTFETITDSVPLNLQIEQKVLGWKEEQTHASIILEYRIINKADTAYQQLHTGIYADFDIHELYKNKAEWDTEYSIGYTYDEEENRFAGLALLSQHALAHHALDLSSRNGNVAEINDSLGREKKYNFLANGNSKLSAGTEGAGNDVATFLGGTIAQLNAHDSEKIAFALLTAPSKEALRQAVTLARERYRQYLLEPPALDQLISCPGMAFTINGGEGSNYEFYADPFGETLIGTGRSLSIGPLHQDTIIYLADASQPWLGDINRILIEVKEPVADFHKNQDTLSINPGETAVLQLTDNSEGAAYWSWNFDNGYQSKKQSPKAFYNSLGEYSIQLQVQNAAGCTDVTEKKIVVVEKKAIPELASQLLCNAGTATIEAENEEIFNLFADQEKTQKIFTGTTYTTPPLSKTTIYYASSGSGAFESDLIPLSVVVYNAQINYAYEVDSTSTERYALKLSASVATATEVGRIDWFINGTLEGNGHSLTVSYSAVDSIMDVQAIVYYQNGCQANIEKEIILLASPKPYVSAQMACKGSAVCIRPAEEGLYYFYADAGREFILKKGREYTTEILSASKTLYVTNISQGHESDTSTVNIMVNSNIANFITPSDTVPPGLTVGFKSTQPEAVSWSWDFGNGINSNQKEPLQHFEEAGTYLVSLTARNGYGCEETYTKSIVVAHLTSSLQQLNSSTLLKVYPNPVKDKLRIEIPPLETEGKLLIRDINGRTISEYAIQKGEKSFQLDVSGLAPAWYLIQLKTKKRLYMNRFLRE